MKETQFPSGWDRERVARLITEYDLMDEDQQVAENELIKSTAGQTMMMVPTEIVPAIQELIAKYTAI